jgi:pimeloyl-ACP methyl ester carboxylesterase
MSKQVPAALACIFLMAAADSSIPRASPTAVFFGPHEYLTATFYVPLVERLAKDGFQIATIDIPCQGDLDCWRRKADTDPNWLASWLDNLPTQVDRLGAGPIVAIGTSRSGFIALLAAAHDRRLHNVIAVSPVVELTRLEEFKGFANSQRSSTDLYALAPALAERSVFIEIGSRDERVGTEPAVKLAREIATVGRPVPDVTLIVAPADGHASPDDTFDNAERWVTARVR